MNVIEVFSQPFMLRALLAGVIVASLSASLGIFITLRKQSFLADGVAHASLAGIAIGLVVAWQPLVWASGVAVVMAIGITWLKRQLHLSFDSAIGIFYTLLFALGVVIINLQPGYRPELFSYLFGSILAVGWNDVWLGLALLLISTAFLALNYNGLVYSTFDPESAQIRGVRVARLEYALNILTAVVIVLAIKLLGVILVTAMLIIPATAAKLTARSFYQMLPLANSFAISATVLGIISAYYLETVPGATIVLTAGGLFVLTFLISRW